MQVVNDRAQPDTNVKHFFHKKTPRRCFVQVLIERFTFDEIHHQVPMPILKKLIVNMGEAWMRKAR